MHGGIQAHTLGLCGCKVQYCSWLRLVGVVLTGTLRDIGCQKDQPPLSKTVVRWLGDFFFYPFISLTGLGGGAIIVR